MPCTTILVGKDASYDGSTIIARNDDSGSGRYDPKKFVAVSPAEQPREYHSVISRMTLTLPDDPCAYAMVPNAGPDRGILAESAVSVRNVAMSATETISVNSRVLAADPFVEYRPATGAEGEPGYEPEQPGGFGEEDIITLVLPYVHTAREGVRRVADLLESVGTYESNGIIIADVDEIWYVETIGGHHWIARRVPDDAYAVVPNQLGIDFFDIDDAFGQQREFMCSADLVDFIAEHHLAREMNPSPARINAFNPRRAFGTATPKDHIYNTPRAWYMQRHLNPSSQWELAECDGGGAASSAAAYEIGLGSAASPAAVDVDRQVFRPESNDIPWCRVPDDKVTIEDVDFLMSSHFEGTPYDPYGTTGTPESRHRYRPIGVNRTGQMVAMQIRPYVPDAYRSVMWIAYGSGPFTTAAPFYANVAATPAYLRETPVDEVSTDCLYWSNRLIAALADAHYFETSNLVEQYIEDVQAHGHRTVAETDRLAQSAGRAGKRNDSSAESSNEPSAESSTKLATELAVEPAAGPSVNLSASSVAGSHAEPAAEPAAGADAVRDILEQANESTAAWLRKRTSKLLFDVLYTTSNLMHNSFAMSDHWTK
ncbi:C69 family dipeptidase [Bifidobacterium choloepi]|uniref:Dipeptidase n=1 Tax=Bifidobacterium choloepi TaxID=2614131 RepID=A0A6I5NET8_9BIFI|nr:C69 family dipeptidase [Bifidobacterium choloepi]NEG69864.1 C69 family dipeptidase [Bifidobacterium choloepi]